MLFEVFRKGASKRLIWACDGSGKSRGRDYFEGLDIGDQTKFEPAFNQLTATGEYKNTEKFRHETDGIFVFKIHKHRLSCFLDGEDIVILHGFSKKTTRAKREARELKTAMRLRDEYLDRKTRESQ